MTDTDTLPAAPAALSRVFWDSAAEPGAGHTLASVLYGIRVHDAADGLLMDPMSMADITEGAEILALDALVTQAGRLRPKMDALMRIMAMAGTDLQPLALQISEPLRRYGGVHVAALFELSDGQTITVWFHNPDTTPAKFGPADDLVSWKWQINKKDVTIVVAPESGQDLNLREVARRIMKLAAKNSAAFAKSNAKRAETMAAIEALKGEVVAKQGILAGLLGEIEVAKVAKVERDAAAEKAAADAGTLPEGWTEASPGGIATNPDKDRGGIVDKAIKSGRWFIVPNDDEVSKYLKAGETFETRREAFEDLAAALAGRDEARAFRAEREQQQRQVPAADSMAERLFKRYLLNAGYDPKDGAMVKLVRGEELGTISLAADGLTIYLKRQQWDGPMGANAEIGSLELPYDTGRTVDENAKLADSLVWQIKAAEPEPVYESRAIQAEGYELGLAAGRAGDAFLPSDSPDMVAALAKYEGMPAVQGWLKEGFNDGFDAGRAEREAAAPKPIATTIDEAFLRDVANGAHDDWELSDLLSKITASVNALQAAGLLDAEREALGNQAVDRWAERELAVNG